MTEASRTGNSGAATSGAAGEGGDRRESALERESGAPSGAANIREQQGNSAGGMVPPSFTGSGEPEDPAAGGHPEDAAAAPADPDAWDSEG